MHSLVRPAQLVLKNGTDTIKVRPVPATAGDPVMCRTWDLGSPDVRFVSTPNPGADGVTESVGFLGSRTVTLDLQILGDSNPDHITTHDAYWYVSRLARMAHPWAQPILEINRGDETTRDEVWRMVLRASPYTLAYGKQSAAMVEMQLSFVCPLGLLESYPGKRFPSPAPNVGARTDWAFPATFPKGFGITGSQYPIMTIPVGGDAAIQPCIYITGPAVNPDLRSGDDRFRFNGLTLGVGESVKIDMSTGDILINRGTGATIPDDMSAYALVDWNVSTYWTWQPGSHQLILYSTTATALVEFSERRLTI